MSDTQMQICAIGDLQPAAWQEGKELPGKGRQIITWRLGLFFLVSLCYLHCVLCRGFWWSDRLASNAYARDLATTDTCSLSLLGIPCLVNQLRNESAY